MYPPIKYIIIKCMTLYPFEFALYPKTKPEKTFKMTISPTITLICLRSTFRKQELHIGAKNISQK